MTEADMDDVDYLSEDSLLAGIELATRPSSGPCAKVLIAGDICMAYPGRSCCTGEPSAPWSGLGDSIASHGLRIANLECPLTLSNDAITKSGPHLRAHPAAASMIRAGGFDVVGLANNHIRDYGSRGIEDTIAACESVGLRTLGAGKNLAEARLPLVMTVEGLRVGILAVAENEFGSAGNGRAGGNPYHPLTTPRDITDLREIADAVIVLFHGGTEGYRLPSPRMTQTCRSMVDAGATAVVCCHTHVPSGIEIYRGAPIAYGTGNFLFDPPAGNGLPDGWHVGYCVGLSISRQGVYRFALIPYRQVAGRGLVEPMDDVHSRVLARQTTELSATIRDEARLAQRWAELCSSRRASLLSGVLGLNRIEIALVRRGAWPFWRISRRRLPALLNVMRCESHHDALVTLLEHELRDVRER
jgi:poly-gamma-glutamate synthesis protein (capsule biosynthesis protein)